MLKGIFYFLKGLWIKPSEESKIFWSEVEKYIAKQTTCHSGWTVSYGSTSIGFYIHAVDEIKKYVSGMKEPYFAISEDRFSITGKMKGGLVDGVSFDKGEVVKIHLRK